MRALVCTPMIRVNARTLPFRSEHVLPATGSMKGAWLPLGRTVTCHHQNIFAKEPLPVARLWERWLGHTPAFTVQLEATQEPQGNMLFLGLQNSCILTLWLLRARVYDSCPVRDCHVHVYLETASVLASNIAELVSFLLVNDIQWFIKAMYSSIDPIQKRFLIIIHFHTLQGLKHTFQKPGICRLCKR